MPTFLASDLKKILRPAKALAHADEAHLRLIGNGLEVLRRGGRYSKIEYQGGIGHYLPNDPHLDFKVDVPLLLDMMNKLNPKRGESIDITFDRDKLELVFVTGWGYAAFEQRLRVTSPLDRTEYAYCPPAPWGYRPANTLRFVVRKDNLAALLSNGLACSSRDETRPILSGPLLIMDYDADSREWAFTTVATDTYRLLLHQHLWDTGSGLDIEPFASNWTPAGEEGQQLKMIVPRDWAKFALGLCNTGQKQDPTVILGLDYVEGGPHRIHIETPTQYFSARGIEGQYVNYPKVHEPRTGHRILFRAGELADLIYAALPLVSKDSYRIVLQSTDEEIQLRSVVPALGEFNGRIMAERIEHSGWPQIEIAFNVNYMLDFLEMAGPMENVWFEADAPLKSMRVSTTDDRLTYMLMPMQIV